MRTVCIKNDGKKRSTGVFAILLLFTLTLAMSFMAVNLSLVRGESIDAPQNLSVPPMAYDQNHIVIEWEKPVNYWEDEKANASKKIVDYEVFQDGVSLGLSSINFYTHNKYLAAWNHALERTNAEYADQHNKLTYLSFRATGLSADTAYTFKVRAVYADSSKSAFSKELTVRTQKEYTQVVEVAPSTADVVAVDFRTATETEKAYVQNGNNTVAPANKYRVANFGEPIASTESNADFIAVTKSTQAIQDAIDRTPFGGKTVITGSGDNSNPIYYVTGALFLHSNMTLEVEEGAVILGSPSLDHYQRNLLVYPYSEDIRTQGLLNASTFDYGSLENIRICGEGIIDSNGTKWATATGIQTQYTANDPNGSTEDIDWVLDQLNEEKNSESRKDITNGAGVGQWYLPTYGVTSSSNVRTGILSADVIEKAKVDLQPLKSNGYNSRPQQAIFRGVNGLCLDGLTWTNPSFHGIVHYSCENTTAIGLKVMTWNSHNGDGIEFGDSLGMRIINNFYDSGDDMINFASGQGSVVRNTSGRVATGEGRIINTFGRNGHGGLIAAGSHTAGWIGDLLVEECIYSPSETGAVSMLRMKSGGSTGGGVHNVTIRDCIVHNTAAAGTLIYADRNYSDSNASTAFAPESEVAVAYEYVTIRNITVSGSNVAIINGNAPSTSYQTHAMVLKNVHIEAINRLQNAATITLTFGNVSDIVLKDITTTAESVTLSLGTSNTIRNLTVENVKGQADRTPDDLNWAAIDKLTATTDGGNDVTLSWPEISGATGGYIILVKERNAPQRYFTERAVVSAETTTWTGPLSANTEYDIQIVARSSVVSNTYNLSTEPLSGSVKTGQRTVVDEGAATMSGSIGTSSFAGFSWQTLYWTNADAGLSSGIQYYRILEINNDGGINKEQRAYYDSYYYTGFDVDFNGAPFALNHNARRGYCLSELDDDVNYTIQVSVVTWTGEEYTNTTTMDIKTRPATLMEIPDWSANAALTSTLDSDLKGVTLSWSASDVYDPSRGDEVNKFAGYRIYVDGVPLKAIAASGEVSNHSNAVPNTTATTFYLNFEELGLSPGRHNVSVEAGVEILMYYTTLGNALGKHPTIPDTCSFLGVYNKDAVRNNITMGKWSGHGPSVEIIIAANGTGAILDSIEALFVQGDMVIYAGSNLSDYEGAIREKLTVKEIFSDGSDYVVSSHDYTLSANFSDAGNSVPVTVMYDGLITTFNVKVINNDIIAIEVDAFDQTGLNIYAGHALSEYFDAIKTKLTVKATYHNGDEAIVAPSDYTLSGNISDAGSKTIMVTSTVGSGITDSFLITVTAVKADKIDATFSQGGMKIYPGELEKYESSLKSLLTVVITNNDASTKAATSSEYSLSGDISAEGNVTITVALVSDNSIVTTFNLTVSSQEEAQLIASIKLDSEFEQGSVKVYSTDDTDVKLKNRLSSIITVIAEQNDGEEFEVADYTLSISGTTVTVLYSGQTVTFTVVVTPYALESITLDSPYNQGSTVIYQSDNTDAKLKAKLSEIVVKANYNDGTVVTVPAANYTLSLDGSKIVVLFSEKTVDINVTVTPVVLVSITAALANQEGIIIKAGEDLADYAAALKAKLTVTGTNNDSTSAGALTDYTLSGDISTSGSKTITVTVNGTSVTATFTVVVTAYLNVTFEGVGAPGNQWAGDAANYSNTVGVYAEPSSGKVVDKWVIVFNSEEQEFINAGTMQTYIRGITVSGPLTITRLLKNEFAHISISFEGDGVDSENEWEGFIKDFNVGNIAEYDVPAGKEFAKWSVSVNNQAAVEVEDDYQLITLIGTFADGDSVTVTAVWIDSAIVVNKAALEAKYNSVKDTEKAGYTDESWNNFEAKLGSALEVIEDSDATQEQVDGALLALTQAFEALKDSSGCNCSSEIFSGEKLISMIVMSAFTFAVIILLNRRRKRGSL